MFDIPKIRRLLSEADKFRDSRDWARASEMYRRYLNYRPSASAIWVQLGHSLKEADRPAQALVAYSHALALRPHDPDLLLNLGHLQKLMGHRRKAVEFYSQSASLDGNRAAIEELRGMGEFTSLEAATAALAKSPGKSAEDRRAPSVALIAARGFVRRMSRFPLRGLLSRADDARDRRDWARAADLYGQYLDARPRDFAIWVQRGHALKEEGQPNAALAAYEKALAINRHDADLLLSLGHLYKVMNRLDRAVEYYRLSAAADPSGPAVAELMALNERAPVLGAHISLGETSLWARLSSSRFRAQADKARDRRDWRQAADLYRRYLHARPAHFAIWVQLGHALKEAGQHDAALAAYKQAMHLNAGDACDLLTNLGHLFDRDHQSRAAMAFYGLSAKHNRLAQSIRDVQIYDGDAFVDLIAPYSPPTTQSLLAPKTTRAVVCARKIAVFTIASKNYLSYVRVLMDSLSKFSPHYSLYLCLADELDGHLDPRAECFNIIECKDIGIRFLEDMSIRYDIMEFNTAIKPFMFRWLINNTEFDSIIYMDPDTQAFSRFSALEYILESNLSVVLTPHITRPIEDKKIPNDYHMLQAGTFNLGFAAINRCEESRFFISWWGRRLETAGYAAFEQNLFTDQKWCDLAPSFLNNLFVLKDLSYNVAYWNLSERDVCQQADGWMVNGDPLAFFHFSGVNALDDSVLSKHQNRFEFSSVPALKPLFAQYREALILAGWENTRAWPYRYAHTQEGMAIPPIVRDLYRQTAPYSNLFEDISAHDFLLAMCNAPDSEGRADAERPISRLMAFIHGRRPDLQAAFNLDDLAGRQGFHDWFESAANREYGLPSQMSEVWDAGRVGRFQSNLSRGVEEFAPDDAVTAPRPNRINSLLAPAPIECFLDEEYISSLMYLVWLSRPDLQRAFNLDTAEGQRSFAYWYTMSANREMGLDGRIPTTLEYTSGVVAARAAAGEERALPGANLIGYAHAVLGMGEHVRMSAAALETTTVPFGVLNFDVGVEARLGAKLDHGALISNNPFSANILHINADQMIHAYSRLGHKFFLNRYNIGYWAWELAKSPNEWQPVVDMIDEIWAPSLFIKDAFSEVARCPVVLMPLCVTLPSFKRIDRASFGIPKDAFAFLYTFDFLSYVDRKNPFAAIRAFHLAFPGRESNTCLVLKVQNGNVESEQWKMMLELIAMDERIIVINRTLPRDEVLALFDACDCFVSLHRSEGFGRGPAEAMYLGKPVIVTNYSGNTDFTRPDNSCLVNYRLVPVQDGQYPFHSGQVWADPDIEHAAWHMSSLVQDSRIGQELGRRARTLIREKFSQENIGRMYAARLRELRVI